MCVSQHDSLPYLIGVTQLSRVRNPRNYCHRIFNPGRSICSTIVPVPEIYRKSELASGYFEDHRWAANFPETARVETNNLFSLQLENSINGNRGGMAKKSLVML